MQQKENEICPKCKGIGRILKEDWDYPIPGSIWVDCPICNNNEDKNKYKRWKRRNPQKKN